jgi:superfamily II DNA/RNA helicase
MSDILDNRTPDRSLAPRIRTILQSSQMARFAVGYFFLSGFEAIADSLDGVDEIRLLIGNTSNQQTIEQLAEGYHRLEMVSEVLEKQAYPKRIDANTWAEATAKNIRQGIEVMDQTDAGERLLVTLVQMIEQKRLKVKIFTKGRLHAKAYIFSYGQVYDLFSKPIPRSEHSVAIVGSSNLSLSGVAHNTELNVTVHGNDNHAELVSWFDTLWGEAEDFDAALMREMQQSWAVMPASPYDIYMKTLYTLVKDRLEEEPLADLLWDDEITSKLADFQKVAVRQAAAMIRKYNGAFVSDVVGLGKSYIGAAIVKHFERTENARSLIICPAPLTEMWERYDERYQLNAKVISMGHLRENEGINYLLERYPDRDFVLIDESHNLRHRDTQRYRVVESFMATGRRCCLLTATPRNKDAWDIYHQMKLFHTADQTDIPIEPPHLRDYFNLVAEGERLLPLLLAHILLRRTRNHILRWYGFDSETHEPVDPSRFAAYQDGNRRAYVMVGGKHQFFPRRDLITVEYSIEDTYQGLYQQILAHLGAEPTIEKVNGKRKPKGAKQIQATGEMLSFARYGLWRYVRTEKQNQAPYTGLQKAGANLRGLIRIMLFKRFESSVYAFCRTIARLIQVHEGFLTALKQGIVAAGKDAQTLLYESDTMAESDLLDSLADVSKQYNIADFESDQLYADVQHDCDLLRRILALVEPITPERDAKLQILKARMAEPPISGNKCLIFTQYADTAYYLYQQLNLGGDRADIEVIYSREKSKAAIVGRFAPNANPEYRGTGNQPEIKTLIATDVLSEGLNLQDCNLIINYDLHWNPVRLIQRFGRIDRIGSTHDVVCGFNFLPEIGIESALGLRERLHQRIQEIHDTIGEDAAILDKTEQLNPESFYAIYEQNTGALAAQEDQDQIFDLNEAEEMLRQLKQDDPAEYNRIVMLQDGIRARKRSERAEYFALCQAGNYKQMVLANADGEIISRDISTILGVIRATRSKESSHTTLRVSGSHNRLVAQIRETFTQEVKQRQTARAANPTLSPSQQYVARQLQDLYKQTDDEDTRVQINILSAAFRGLLTTAIIKELNRLKANSVHGEILLHRLRDLYVQHDMDKWSDRQQQTAQNTMIPRVVCSEELY